MKKTDVQFAVKSQNRRISTIGKSFVNTPAIQFKGGSIKWFDDAKLLKK